MMKKAIVFTVLLSSVFGLYAQEASFTALDSSAGIPSGFSADLPSGAAVPDGTSGIDFLKSWTSRITFYGYAQAGYTWKTQAAGGGSSGRADTNTLDLKRTLLWVKARVTDRWSMLFMHDFSSVVQEFYTDYRVSGDASLTVRIGQFKNPFSLENPLSPTKMELIDVYSQGVTYLAGCGSDPLFGVQYGRDLGVEAYGTLFGGYLYYELAMMQGQGINRKDGNNKKDVICRLDVRCDRHWRIVLSGQKGTGHAVQTSRYNPELSVGEDYTRDRWSAGAEWKSSPLVGSRSGMADYWKTRGAAVHGEVLGGRDGNVDSYGGYVTGSVPVCEALDVVASVDYFRYNDRLGMAQTNVTAGFQHWFFRVCRAQVQYTVANPVGFGEKRYGVLQTQVQVAF